MILNDKDGMTRLLQAVAEGVRPSKWPDLTRAEKSACEELFNEV